jgi:hypothetical protein
MRLWTLHPRYLDARGLVALWREALLAQAVLQGKTHGYIHHPQLIRFRETPDPVETIAAYLRDVRNEGIRRGYRFDETKIASSACVHPIETTQGQLDYEWVHLKGKLRIRTPAWFVKVQTIVSPEAHPLFRIVPGPVAEWEIRKLKP